MNKLRLLLSCLVVIFSSVINAAIQQGSCGLGNVKFTLDYDGILWISGTGSMRDYSYPSSPSPWDNNRSKIKELRIGAGITNVGNYALYYSRNLTTVDIPNSVTIIGNSAFRDTGLLSISIPNSVTDIGIYAFSGTRLSSVSIPNSVVNIGDYAFYLSDLKTLTIGNSVKNIGSYAFKDCTNLTEITINAVIPPVFVSINPFDKKTRDQCKLIVPKESLDAYRNADGWKDFAIITTNENPEINDDCTIFSHAQEYCEKLSYTRNISNTNWQALYVPFCMTYDDWKDDFEVAYINDVRQYDDNEDGIADRTEVEVFKMKEGKSIEPNTPYLIKAKTTGEKTITLEDATLYKTEETSYSVTSWFNSFNFVGTYHTISDMATKGYYAMAGGALKQATSDAVTLQPFRWYLSVTDRNGNPVSLNSKSMSIVFDDGETTGIESVNNEKDNSSIHTLTGISKGNNAKALTPGIYIKNGKKFIVK